MAAPNTPTNPGSNQGNNQIYIFWDLMPTATSYTIQRSTDGVNYSTLASPSVNYYTDSTAALNTLYYYQILATNISGSSPYCTPITNVLTPNGELALYTLRQQAQQRADRVNSNFVTTSEWNSYINQSMMELYDLLVTSYQDYFLASVSFISDGSSSFYDLPNGTNYSGAKAFYKLLGVDLQVATVNNAFVTLDKFNFRDRNTYVYPNSSSTIYGVFNLRYRVMGSQIEFIPTPSANQTIKLWYIPRVDQLIADSDSTNVGISGWDEYVIVDAAIKALQKEESLEAASVLMQQKMALKQRIEESAVNKDAGRPDTITDTQSGSYFGTGGMPGYFGPIGGF